MTPPPKAMPHNIEAERALLGAILQHPDILLDPQVPNADDFYRPEHGELLTVLLRMYDQRIPIETASLYPHLTSRCPSFAELAAMEESSTMSNWAYYARGVREMAVKRRTIAALDAARERAFTHTCTSEELVNLIQSIEPTAELDESMVPAVVGAREALDEAEATERGETPPGIPSGFTGIDALAGAMNPGGMTVVAARPGAGKSLFCAEIAYRNTSAGRKVVYFSLEMKRKQFMQRMLASAAGVELEHIRTGKLTVGEWGRLTQAQNDLAKHRLYIDDNFERTATSVRRACRRLAKRLGGIDLIVVDYVGLLQPEDGRVSREQQIAASTKVLRLTASEQRCPIIVLAQLNREMERRQNGKPILSDLRESGSLEQDAERVMFLHQDSPADNTVDVRIEKNRYGERGVVPLRWEKKYIRMRDF